MICNIAGANFSMYPDNTRLVVADPNPYFEKYFNEHKAKFPNVKCETIIVAKGAEITDAGVLCFLGVGGCCEVNVVLLIISFLLVDFRWLVKGFSLSV